MRSQRDLASTLRRIDGRGYKAYKDIAGSYDFGSYTLHVDHVQGDPFAAPSIVRVVVPHSTAKIPAELHKNPARKVALEDFLTRAFHRETAASMSRRGSGKSGLIAIARPSQQIIERTAMEVTSAHVEARFFVGLPAYGRTIRGREAQEMLFDKLPRIVSSSLLYEKLDHARIEEHVAVSEDASFIRASLAGRGLVAFVANGAILPRKSGVDERPLRGAIPFTSPAPLEVSFTCPNRTVAGMGIAEGVTLIVGGGYHGKSTLLNALSLGVYNHIPGDGREFVVTLDDAVKIRAEDGRYIEKVDISFFIGNLPTLQDTASFSTENGSGSTSQAANITEAVELGARLLLIDEDTSATNFMIRDERMQALVGKNKEPITPLIDTIRTLYEQSGVSTILVMGGSGDYFDVADLVVMMDSYRARDVTEEAEKIAARYRTERKAEGKAGPWALRERIPSPSSLTDGFERGVKVRPRGMDGILYGKQEVDLRRVEQLVEEAQVRSVGDLVYHAGRRVFDGQTTLARGLDFINDKLSRGDLKRMVTILKGDYARPRKYEIGAAINRLRSFRCKKQLDRS